MKQKYREKEEKILWIINSGHVDISVRRNASFFVFAIFLI